MSETLKDMLMHMEQQGERDIHFNRIDKAPIVWAYIEALKEEGQSEAAKCAEKWIETRPCKWNKWTEKRGHGKALQALKELANKSMTEQPEQHAQEAQEQPEQTDDEQSTSDAQSAQEQHENAEEKRGEKTMLKTNSKKACENIRAYIVEHFTAENYSPEFDYIEQAQRDNAAGIRNVDIFSMVAHAIAATFYNEKCKHDMFYKAGRVSHYNLFVDWCTGLPSILDTCYYWNRSAVDDLGAILEETDEEKAKYTEEQAEQRLTQLIYREIYSVKGGV